MSDLPAAVQNRITAQGVPAEGIGIDKKTIDGRTVYAVEFKQEGKNTKLEIAEDGSVLSDSRH